MIGFDGRRDGSVWRISVGGEEYLLTGGGRVVGVVELSRKGVGRIVRGQGVGGRGRLSIALLSTVLLHFKRLLKKKKKLEISFSENCKKT